MKINNRLDSIGVYHFKTIDDIKAKLKKEGKRIIDLSIGDPDLNVDDSILQGLVKGFENENFNKYPPYDGINELKCAVINYYYNRFGVSLDLDEVVILIGSKEGISNVIPAVCDVGDIVIVPQPGYPVYSTCAKLWGCLTYTVPIKESNNYLMDVSEIPDDVISVAKLIFINYPNNPTGAKGNPNFFSTIIEFCKENNIVLCNDAAYNEIISPGETPISILQFDESKHSIEFGTFSKLYNMTGFRIGYAVGNKEVISALLKVKSNLDSGQFIPIQIAACEALKLNEVYGEKIRKIYSERKAIAETILTEKNIEFFHSDSTFYIWCKTPKGYTTNEFCSDILQKYGVVVTPGSCFGTLGYDFFRIALTCDANVIKEGLSKLDKYND
jgi:LL-diaminopimelate aminotransferase